VNIPLFLLGLGITAVWGFNFIVIKVGTDHIPPLLLAALRFVFTAFPAVFFVKRPQAPWSLILGYGLFLGVGEFGLLFTAIKLGAPSGLSSLILQSQVFFTALLAARFSAEPVRARSLLGMLIAACGLATIGMQAQQPGAWGGHFALALTMLILAAFMWAIANILARRAGNVGAVRMMVWSSLASPIPLLLLSWIFDGSTAIAAAFTSLSWLSVGALAYLVLLSTLFGYSAWNHLIVKYGAARVAPFSMLVPIFGVTSGSLILHEPLTLSHLLSATLVLTGVALHLASPPPTLLPTPPTRP
jgi:O-acetylserine/cysteine efflux transporter